MVRGKIGVKEGGANLMNFTKMLQQVLTFWEIMHRDSGLTQWSCQEAIMAPFKSHNQLLNAHVVTVC